MKTCKLLLSFFLISLTSLENSNLGATTQNILNKRNTPEFVYQSSREIPVERFVDVVVVGGTLPAVAAAVAASESGASVFLIASRPYLGEDLCATLRLKADENTVFKTELDNRLFNSSLKPKPLDVKAILNNALLNSEVEFVFGAYPSDVLWDRNGNPAGIVISNRAGRQAIIAKTIIDATDRAWVARMAGAKAKSWSGSAISFERTIVKPAIDKSNGFMYNKTLEISMPDLSFLSFARAEQIARELTYVEGQLRASESMFHIPPDPIICINNNLKSDQITKPDVIAHFKPYGIERMYVLSGSAGLSRQLAESLLQPGAMTEIGEFIGRNAAIKAKSFLFPDSVYFDNRHPVNSIVPVGDVHELLTGFRHIEKQTHTVVSPPTGIKVLGKYDIVVIGGGTSGAPATIAAARKGASVLVVEYLEGLGGTGTLGLIGRPWYGRNVGFASEVPFPSDNIEPKMEWYREEITKAGGEIMLGAIGCGVYVVGNSVKGAIIATPEGRFAVLADVVIDATGSGDIAIAAGASYMYGETENHDIALQGSGLPSRPLRGSYLNTDYLLVDEVDMVDVWRTLVSVQITKNKESFFDAGTMIHNRERRRVVGDHILTYLDQIAERTYPDAVVYSGSNYDSHGYTSSPFFALLPHDEISRKANHPAPGGTCYTPYRCFLPKGLDGILVIGLGMSMERDASAMVRMQFDMANQGYATGVAATMAVSSGVTPRNINVRELQRHLVKIGNLPSEVLKHEDSFPLSLAEIENAVQDYGNATNPESAGKPLAIILTHREAALPIIIEAYHNADGQAKLLYAQLLAICGSNEGLPTLLTALQDINEWEEKIYQGRMADYAHLPTPTDAVILASSYTGDTSVLPELIRLVEMLDADVTLSHHRTLALALERLAHPDAAEPLADLLKRPGMRGHAMMDLDDALTELKNDGRVPGGRAPLEKRTRALREIILARALYRCGDFDGLGKTILQEYQKDMQGLFARHANIILN